MIKCELARLMSCIKILDFNWSLPGNVNISCRKASFYLLIIFFLWGQLASVYAIEAEMIKDINKSILNPGICSEIVESNGIIFFCARDSHGDEELWKYDPTGSGRVLVKDIYPDPDRSSRPHELIDVGGTLFFIAYNGNEYKLWKSDGTQAGTQLVRPPFGLSNPSHLINVNGTLFFVREQMGYYGDLGYQYGYHLWKSDGTEVGTVKLKDLGRFRPESFMNVNGTLFFLADGEKFDDLWKTDGTEAGTVKVKESVWLRQFADFNGALVYTTYQGELWKSDGTETGTVLIKAGINQAEHLTVVGGLLYFTVSHDDVHGKELWRSDGTEAGTVLVKDIYAGRTDSEPKGLVDVNGALFFIADDGIHGDELWKSDGSEEGTVLVKDIRLGSDGANIDTYTLINVEGTLFFWADDGVNGRELWKTNGTASGTVLVKDIQVGSLGGTDQIRPQKHASIGNKLFFSANDGVNAGELWKSDGTEAGTVQVNAIGAHTDSSYPTYSYAPLAATQETLYFIANDGHGKGLWKTDGTEGGTALVKERTLEWQPIMHELVNLNGWVYFIVLDGKTSEYSLWKTNSTEKSMVKVEDLGRLSSPNRLLKFGHEMFFTLSIDGNRAFLVKSNGTPGGIELVKDFSEGYYGADILKMQVVGSKLFIKVVTYGPGEQVHLWVVDSANENVVQLDWGGPYYNPSNFFEYKGQILFTAYGSLYQTDGTKAGTKKVENTNFPGGSNFMKAWDTWIFSSGENYEKTFWKFDGSPQKTVQIINVAGGMPIYINGTLFFYHYDAVTGNELWKTDGTQAGTKMVKDIWPGSESSYPQELTSVNGILFFSADDGVHGKELWMSDGTEGGTRLVRDIFPPVERYTAAASVMKPRGLRRLNDMLIFIANDGIHNSELWKVELTDTDNDGVIDDVDQDDDNDGVSDRLDLFPLNPDESADADRDGIGDNADTDDDNDGLPDVDERRLGTNPNNKDSDNDGLDDGWEVDNGLDPTDGYCPSWVCGAKGGWRHAIHQIMSR